jgi:hypothetical protein
MHHDGLSLLANEEGKLMWLEKAVELQLNWFSIRDGTYSLKVGVISK